MLPRLASTIVRILLPAGVSGLLLLATACGASKRPAGEPLLVGHGGGASWNLWLRPDPPKQKGNSLWVEVLGADGMPAADANVTLGWLMPAMGSMAEMRGNGEVTKEGNGLFRIAFDFPINGTWTLHLAITTPRGTATGEYTATVGAKGLKDVGGGGGEAAVATPAPEKVVAVTLPPIELPPAALEPLRTALGAYDEARAMLAADRLNGLAARAGRLGSSLRAARGGLGEAARADVAGLLDQGTAAAGALGSARDLANARAALGDVSRALIGLAGADARLAAGWQSYTCPMTSTFPKWMQPGRQKQNPYLGKAMTSRGEPSDWAIPAPVTAAAPELAANAGGVVRMDTARRQAIGVTTGTVQRRPLVLPVRAVGKVVFDETKLTDVTVKYKGFIGRLYVDRPGQPVRRGQPLFTLYSPELFAAQQEYLIALHSQLEARQTGAPDRADYLVTAARQRLRLWDLEPGQIDRLARTGKPLEEMPIFSPASGYVVEKYVVAGGAVEPGMKLFRLARLDTVWVEAEVYESELPLLHVGDSALVSFPYLPGRSYVGTIGFVYPYLDAASRTGRVRVQLANRGLELKPDMFANVTLTKSLGERLVVPADAVLYAGDKSFVFVDLGQGRLAPRRVVVGQTTTDQIEILEGLRAGETIVTSGNFLVAAESRLKLAMDQWR